VGHVGGVQARGGHLVEQRLEGVEVVAVDEGDLHVGVPELAGRVEAAEAGADDGDLHAGPIGGWHSGHQ